MANPYCSCKLTRVSVAGLQLEIERTSADLDLMRVMAVRGDDESDEEELQGALDEEAAATAGVLRLEHELQVGHALALLRHALLVELIARRCSPSRPKQCFCPTGSTVFKCPRLPTHRPLPQTLFVKLDRLRKPAEEAAAAAAAVAAAIAAAAGRRSAPNLPKPSMRPTPRLRLEEQDGLRKQLRSLRKKLGQIAEVRPQPARQKWTVLQRHGPDHLGFWLNS